MYLYAAITTRWYDEKRVAEMTGVKFLIQTKNDTLDRTYSTLSTWKRASSKICWERDAPINVFLFSLPVFFKYVAVKAKEAARRFFCVEC